MNAIEPINHTGRRCFTLTSTVSGDIFEVYTTIAFLRHTYEEVEEIGEGVVKVGRVRPARPSADQPEEIVIEQLAHAMTELLDAFGVITICCVPATQWLSPWRRQVVQVARLGHIHDNLIWYKAQEVVLWTILQ